MKTGPIELHLSPDLLSAVIKQIDGRALSTSEKHLLNVFYVLAKHKLEEREIES